MTIVHSSASGLHEKGAGRGASPHPQLGNHSNMSRKQTPKSGRSNKKNDVERKRDERAARRAIAKDRKNRPQDGDDGAEFVSFSNQLQALGLKLREVPGDG